MRWTNDRPATVEEIVQIALSYDTVIAMAFRKCLGLPFVPMTAKQGTIVPVDLIEDYEVLDCFANRESIMDRM